MAFPKKVILFLLIFRTSESLWARARKPPWYKELKAVCLGAEDYYYVDLIERKCCKCSPCYGMNYPREIDCHVPNNSNYCAALPTDCVYDEGFDSVFLKRSTTVSTTIQSVSHVITEAGNRTMMPRTSVKSQVGNGINQDVVNPVVVYVFVGIFVALVIVLAVILYWQCVKTGSGPLRKLKHICTGGIPSDAGISHRTSIADTSQSSREEAEGLVFEENCDAENESPPRFQSSLYGPQEMTHTELQRINSRNEGTGNFSDPCIGSRDMQSGGGSDTSRLTSYNAGNRPQASSVNDGTVISGSQNVVLVPNNTGTVHMNNANITIIMPGNNDSRSPAVGLPFTGNFCRENGALDGNPNGYRHDPLPCPNSEIKSHADVRFAPCFPAQPDSGECVTSASPPLSRQEVGPGGLVWRQSSQNSSTSIGPVENSAEDFQGGKSVLNQVSRSQDSPLPVYQSQSSSISIPTTSTRASSSLRGPVQHSNRSDHLLHGNTSTTRQLSEGESLNSSTHIHSPQADLELV